MGIASNPNSVGTSEDEVFFGTTGANAFVGGKGDDALLGDAGSDQYVYASGDGNDVIVDGGHAGDTDKLLLTNLTADGMPVPLVQAATAA